MDPLLVAIPAAVAAAAGLTAYGAMNPRSQLFGPTIRYTPAASQLALTFDDGPNPSVTPHLLDLLDRYRARATFFMVGKFVRTNHALVREIAARGHAIGNHTETHPNLFWLGPAQLRDQLGRCQQAIAAAAGAAPVLMRPPYGLRSPLLAAAVRAAGLREVVMWTLIPGDWLPRPVEWLIERMKPIADHAARAGAGKPARSRGDVLCLHDGDHKRPDGDRMHTVAALEYWLPRWRDLGLEFVTISEAANNAAK